MHSVCRDKRYNIVTFVKFKYTVWVLQTVPK